MYTISKGPSQIVAKTRRGLAQKLESLDTIRDMTRKNSDSDDMDWSNSLSPSPRPVFQTVSLTGKRAGSSNNNLATSHRHHHHHQQQPEILTRSQEELIKYVYERWQRVNRELKTASLPAAEGSTVTYYKDVSPNPALQDFEPFDLEGWWGRRLYHTLTQSS